MGTLKSTITADMSVFFNTDEFAETILHETESGTQSTLTVLIVRNGSNREPGFRDKTTTATLTIQKSELDIDESYRFLFDAESVLSSEFVGGYVSDYSDVFSSSDYVWELAPEGVTYEDDDIFKVEVIREQP